MQLIFISNLLETEIEVIYFDSKHLKCIFQGEALNFNSLYFIILKSIIFISKYIIRISILQTE